MHREPKLLPCTHTVCLECLKKLTEDKKYFLCPECRTEHTVPKRGVITFKENHTMVQLLEAGKVRISTAFDSM